MGRRSAGLMLFRRRGPEGVEVLLGHMGGPLWARRDAGAWSIPKGEYDEGEDALAAALREFAEEMGAPPPPGTDIALGEFRQASGKRVVAFAREGDLEAGAIRSNTFTMEWPRGSGRQATFPEIDRAQWMAPSRARECIVRGQAPAIDALLAHLGG